VSFFLEKKVLTDVRPVMPVTPVFSVMFPFYDKLTKPSLVILCLKKLLSGDKSKMLFRASQYFCISLSHDEYIGNDNSFYCTINIICFPCKKT
jgi:hypothetical protein